MYRVVSNLVINSSNLSLDTNQTKGGLSLSNPLYLPKECYGRILSATIWNDNPNVTAPNNTIEFTYGGLKTLTFDEGLYSDKDLSERLAETLQNAGLPTDLLVLQADEASGKFSLQNNRGATSLVIDFDTNNYILKTLCGFDNGVVTDPVAGTWLESTNRAALNTVNSYLIHASFADAGYFAGISGSDVCAEVHINTSPGKIINFEPRHPLVYKITQNELDNIYVYLTSETNAAVKTNENWTVVFEFFYYGLIS